MLFRTARHAIPPPIALDFLIPNPVLRRTLCYTSPKYIHHSRAEGARQQKPAQPTRYDTPGAVLTQLEQDFPAFDSQPLATLTDTRVEAFNNAIPELRGAFYRRNVAEISSIWSVFKTRDLLAFFGPSQYGVCSNLIDGYCKHGSYQLSEEEVSLLQEIALVAAAGGATHGLRALMVFHIQNGAPRSALALYGQYVTRLRDKGVIKSDSEERQAEELDSEDFDEATSSHAPSLPFSPVRDEILLCAVAAHAQLDTFNELLPLYLQAATRIVPTTVEEFLPSLRIRLDLKKKIEEYVHRLETASLISRPAALMKQLSNLTGDNASRPLGKIYGRAVEGARGPDAWLAIRPEDLSGSRLLLLPPFFWSSFLRGFLACNRPDLAERLWDDMLKLGVVPDIVTWNALLDGYAELRMIDSVLSTWDVMVSLKVRPDAMTYRALIHALFLVGRYQDALDRFDGFQKDLPSLRTSPDDPSVLMVYNNVLYHLLFASQENKADAIVEKMQSKGPNPDVVTLNIFIRHHARKADLRALARILERFEPAGLKPDIYTFSTLLSAMLKVRPDADRVMVNFMKKHGISPDTTSLTAIIHRQLREATPESFKIAMDLLGKMERNEYENAEPNAITYTSVLTAINRGRWLDRKVAEEHTRRIWERMRERGIRPQRTTYNVLIRASLSNREPEGLQNGMAYYRDMIAQRVHMGNETWYILLRGLIGRRELGLAREVVQDMLRFKTNLTGSLRLLIDKIGQQSSRKGSATHL
ncbi:hypothetical protein LXA43DRAFT_178003 [Ganoderma leucocontextum]|nr:hypothetical protein LXA43DRAFT_178003 [Ganoderma leucocontextum]